MFLISKNQDQMLLMSKNQDQMLLMSKKSGPNVANVKKSGPNVGSEQRTSLFQSVRATERVGGGGRSRRRRAQLFLGFCLQRSTILPPAHREEVTLDEKFINALVGRVSPFRGLPLV